MSTYLIVQNGDLIGVKGDRAAAIKRAREWMQCEGPNLVTTVNIYKAFLTTSLEPVTTLEIRETDYRRC